jgi:hypothetical protein
VIERTMKSSAGVTPARAPDAPSALRGVLTLLLPALLVACSGFSNLSADAPASYSLTGTWKLDPTQSTDTAKTLAQLQGARVKAQRQQERIEQQMPVQGPGGPGRGAGDPVIPPLDRPPMLDVELQTSVLRGGEWLKIDQRDSEFIISNGDTSHSYVPGEKSVVSVPSGVADQMSGWKGKEFRIHIKPQLGPGVTESYTLSDDGKRLIAHIDIAREGRIPAIKVTRVYVPTQEIPQGISGLE